MSDDAAPDGSVAVERDYDLDDVADAGSPERMKALGDPFRQLICDLVLERAMSVSELAGQTGRPKGTVAYHVEVLLDAGLVRVVHTRRVRAVEERFYGRVARTFLIHDETGGVPFLADLLADYDHQRARELGQTCRGASLDEGIEAGWGTATYRRARIPADRVVEFSRRIEALAAEFVDEPRAGDVEFGLYLTLFPTNRLSGRVDQPRGRSQS